LTLRRVVAGLLFALFMQPTGCATTGPDAHESARGLRHGQGQAPRRDAPLRYHPNRPDYATFREANPGLHEPNYLPFMLHRFARSPGIADALIFCRWADAQMPIRVHVVEPSLDVGLQNEFHPIAPARFVAAAEEALEVWAEALEGAVAFERVDTPEDAMLQIVLRGTRAPRPAPGVMRLGRAEGLVDACRAYGWDADAERLRVRFSLPELEIHLADDTGLLPPTIVRRLVIHELGHALGMRGHSPSPGDVMYAELADAPGRDELSLQDVNSFLALYRLPNGTHFVDAPAEADLLSTVDAPHVVPPDYADPDVSPYVDSEHGFEIDLPRSWVRIPEPHGGFFTDGPSWDYNASMRIFVWPSQRIEDFVACCARELLAGSWLRTRTETQHAGRRALRLEIEDSAGQTADTLLFIEIGDGRVMLVAMTRPAATALAWAAWFEASLASLEIWERD
jgi:predicted Zn-dependent protease